VVEFSSEKLKKLRDEICQEHGFSTLSHQFHIFGLSPEAISNAGAGGSDVSGSVESDGAPLPAPPFGPDLK
jgi:hypothetical protein